MCTLRIDKPSTYALSLTRNQLFTDTHTALANVYHQKEVWFNLTLVVVVGVVLVVVVVVVVVVVFHVVVVVVVVVECKIGRQVFFGKTFPYSDERCQRVYYFLFRLLGKFVSSF